MTQEIINSYNVVEELEKAKAVINQFAYSCSHSFRSPLKSLTGLLSLMARGNDKFNAEEKEYISLMVKTVTQMEYLLNEMEEFLNNSKKEVLFSNIQFDCLVESVMSELNGDLVKNRINTSIRIEESSPFFSDENRIKIVLRNLLVNAIQYQVELNDQKSIDVKVLVSSVGTSISISDNGMGIEPDDHKKIFQLFYRGCQNSKGPGVGLYVVNEIVKRLGGTISVASQKGKGANFIVWLPNLPETFSRDQFHLNDMCA